ncbi:hypothetical protein Pogu_1269 [Pyrobaculum oguniense TE7]|uniref:Uncharacterized protein n=1 Tax=Pyrobaculum oguniense (strain DSM 13380 / JCM 10595 / TE7) TaxID=698757 RepID=H6QA95_PYROT|nr:hypothetical protein Pogu_1269 [Pyrobaculum oguniense TE7]
MAEEVWGIDEERRRNLKANLEALRKYAELAAAGDERYWASYVNFINTAYRTIWAALEDPRVRETYLKILKQRKTRD